MQVTLTELTNATLDEVTIPLATGNVVHIKPYNPWGFYKITYDRGAVPEVLSGLYTNRSLAEADARKYLANKNLEIVSK